MSIIAKIGGSRRFLLVFRNATHGGFCALKSAVVPMKGSIYGQKIGLFDEADHIPYHALVDEAKAWSIGADGKAQKVNLLADSPFATQV
ncbi:hypothetical protein A0H81_02132 [Grifola frondosa]|uniref:Uncharacterized protein n=1 Tax=Grifola frondosa TaxID=5627 RepID=A0A1C7MM16_GRIFR|nr:hypothetical protein A0H81_02132 [Grifola frondosa]